MAQFGESGLFEQVLRGGNAGSIAVPQALARQRCAKFDKGEYFGAGRVAVFRRRVGQPCHG
ncbi:hypothetical protein [Bradyrhizobium canariense]|uniref:hypothetical protein n=1 Tax=Bradyrhizobium canariense TaxID=255045 RepID=UPI000A196C82|nr:hypothetical protein [Bradyrhizobium canariense]OSI19715.1 hypothetical protein BST65_39535 [Bradyrhizobium canariense]OSI26390.1 hypothetical protein BST66_39340 [Bradyrhizobium canariense]OSI37903.1 hypothetical protein BSZ20_39380 [Bradyrhizobium canariense]OSI42651.1 hypothetical protein BST67_38720 [Bradyrhizobium canariense]OSI48008.1 hypothetical protein BSZ15_39345 [Bradyrhizobium canariense]